MSHWTETYRGSVFRWEVDHNDHLTVAYYFARFGDAALRLLETVGLGSTYGERSGHGCVTTDCYVRFLHELRGGDIMHIASGVIDIEPDAVVLGHKLINSATGDVCSTVEQRLRHVELDGRTSLPLTPEQRRAVEKRGVRWDGKPRELRPRPGTLEGFRETARDTVKPTELDVLGQGALSAYILRFSAANGHAMAAFGMTPGYMRAERRGFSTFEFQLALDGALRPGDPVRVRSALLHVGNSSMRILHVMTSERSGEHLATLEQLGVHLDWDARRSTPLPDVIRDRARTTLVSTAD